MHQAQKIYSHIPATRISLVSQFEKYVRSNAALGFIATDTQFLTLFKMPLPI
jgi:hypothetical protein